MSNAVQQMASSTSSAVATAFREMGGVFTSLGEAIGMAASSMPTTTPMGASARSPPRQQSSEAASGTARDGEPGAESSPPPAPSAARAAAETAAARAKYGFAWAGRPTVIDIAGEWPRVEEVRIQ